MANLISRRDSSVYGLAVRPGGGGGGRGGAKDPHASAYVTRQIFKGASTIRCAPFCRAHSSTVFVVAVVA
jgi:hypothetical protein